MPPPLPAKGVECPGDYGVHVATAPSDPPSHPQKLGIRVATVPRHGSSVPEVTVLPQGYPWWPRSGSSVSKVVLVSQCWLQCHRGAAVPKTRFPGAGYSQGYLCCPGSSHNAQGTAGVSQGGCRMWQPVMGRNRKTRVTGTRTPQPYCNTLGQMQAPNVIPPSVAPGPCPLPQPAQCHPWLRTQPAIHSYRCSVPMCHPMPTAALGCHQPCHSPYAPCPHTHRTPIDTILMPYPSHTQRGLRALPWLLWGLLWAGCPIVSLPRHPRAGPGWPQ